ncbi:MAG: 16S rRNA processing protein RimM [Deltaproteobacteria bacterium]|nr:16S rRNA processing protein RimM [Deltaproteobacteria bacterium]MBW2016731.1 16S rRNA processing protein RimM [Deltaproteobacteria bacterium]MBW2128836.1 16S rRNA processing protein RimM [Deltaproteobacteria bacterium]MBW2302225.1 16S rRNA processing protein RimM [Deltaproteobacteria bacterium]
MKDLSPDRLLLIGKVVRPHGIEGLMRIISYAESEGTFMKAGIIFLQSPSGEPHEFEFISIRPHKNAHLLRLKGVASREEAEKYKGWGIFIKKDTLKSLGNDEFYWHELIGLKVYSNRGRFLGTLDHILPTGANDIYVVREEGKEILIPAIRDVVEEVNLAERKMIVSEMEGLLELNEV